MTHRLRSPSHRRALALVITAIGVAAARWSIGHVAGATDDKFATAEKAAPETVSAAAVVAEKPAATETETAGRPGRGKNGVLPTFTPEREAAALTFVAAHHAELSPLLAHLKTSRPNEYQRVIRRLFVDSERLAHSREMQPLRYELELKTWKLESRVQLLVARLTMDRTPALERELRTVLGEQLQVRRELLALDREKAMSRVATLDKEITTLDSRRDAVVEELFSRAVNSAGQKKQALKAAKVADAEKSKGDKSNDDKSNDGGKDSKSDAKP